MTLHDFHQTLRFGSRLEEARAAVILLHGRGSSAEDIAGLADTLPSDGVAFLAPSATGGTWYPQRFFVPLAQNEPWLTSALNVIEALLREAESAGIAAGRLGLAGFSQGACLALEYAARRPRRFGFVAAMSGALIGPLDTPRAVGNLQATPILIACAEHDPHIPIAFVERSVAAFQSLGASVTRHLFHGGAHTVFAEEVDWMKAQLRSLT